MDDPVVSIAQTRFRRALPADAQAVARLHADSWRRHYRGAYSDDFLDGDVLADRITVWTDKLSRADPCLVTIVAEIDGLAGFANTVVDDDAIWGALLDNLHVAEAHKRHGIGSHLLTLSANVITQRSAGSGLYVWVLEQNTDAQDFYEARGGRCVGRARVSPPGGIASRLNGSPTKLRYAWRNPAVLIDKRRVA